MAAARLAHRALVTVAAIALAAGLAAPAPAAAVGPAGPAPAGDFERALAQVEGGTPYGALAPRDRAALDAHLVAAGHVVDLEVRPAPAGTAVDGPSAAATWCWIGRVTYTAVAAAGNALYSYLVEGTWCSDGSTVTSAQHEWSSGEASGPGWTYHGVQAFGGGMAANEGRAWSRHRFTLTLAGITWQTEEPCVRMRGTAVGGLGHDGVCGVN